MSTSSDRKETDPTQAGRDAAADLFNLVLIFGIVVIFFLDIIFRRQVFFAGDIMNVYSPWQWYNQEAIEVGRFPLWIDDFFMGFPLFAESQGALFYPPTRLVYAIFPAVRAFSLDVLLHFLLAAWFQYFFARTLKLPPIACLLSAVVFAFSGMFLSLPINFTIFRSIVWIPCVFMFVTLGARRGSLFFPLLTAVALCLQSMGGSLQITGITILALVPYTIFLALSPGKDKQPSLVPILQFVLVLMLSLGLYAFQLVPTLELMNHAWRGTQGGYSVASEFSFPPIHFVDVLLPTFFGVHADGSRLPVIQVAANFFPYIGIIPLLLIPISFGSRRRGMAIMLILVLIFLALAVGKYGIFYKAVYDIVPFFDKFRAPDRFWFIAVLAGSLLAGYGLDRMLASVESDKRVASPFAMGIVALVSLLAALFCIGAIYMPSLRAIWNSVTDPLIATHFNPGRLPFDPAILERWQGHLLLVFLHMLVVVTCFHYAFALFGKKGRSGMLGGALVLIAVVDLYAMSFQVPAMRTTDTSFFMEPPRSARVLMADGEPNRFHVIGRLDYAQRIFGFSDTDDHTLWYNGGGSNDIEDYFAFREELSPNIFMHWRLQSANGFASLFLERYFDLEGSANRQLQTLIENVDREYLRTHNYPGVEVPISEWADHTLLIDLMAARYVLTPHDFVDDERFKLIDDGPMRVYHNRRALPRAWIARPERVVGETLETRHRMETGELDCRQVLMLDPLPRAPRVFREGAEGTANARIRLPSGSGGASARGGAIVDEKVSIDVYTPQPAYLVLADTFYPGWFAEVDNQPVDIFRAFTYFRAIEIPAGEHLVQFYYRPQSVTLGNLLSGITLITILILLFAQAFLFVKPQRSSKE